jgi:saxitoxin biosynthesis operon SxtJ-like protein
LIDTALARLAPDTTTAKQLRSFGLLVGAIFAAIGLLPVLLHGRDLRTWAVVLSALLMIPALVYPKSLGLIYRAWMAVGHVLGWVNTRVILSVIFFVLVTPFGLVRRLLIGDSMGRSFDPSLDTYRVKSKPRPGSHMKQQF